MVVRAHLRGQPTRPHRPGAVARYLTEDPLRAKIQTVVNELLDDDTLPWSHTRLAASWAGKPADIHRRPADAPHHRQPTRPRQRRVSKAPPTTARLPTSCPAGR